MKTARFWECIGVLGGELTEESLEALRAALGALSIDDLLAFQEHLTAQVEKLAPLGLVEEGVDLPPVGDGYAAFLSGVVALGRERVEALVAAGEPAVVAVDSELGLELADLARDVFETRTGELWPEEPGADDGLVLNFIGGGTAEQLEGPVSEVELGVRSALGQLETSESYASAVLASGYSHVDFAIEIFVKTAGSPTHATIKRQSSGLVVDIAVNASGRDGTTFDDGVDRVRRVVDEMADTYGFPAAADVPELAHVEPGERPPDYELFDMEKHLTESGMPPEVVAQLLENLAAAEREADDDADPAVDLLRDAVFVLSDRDGPVGQLETTVESAWRETGRMGWQKDSGLYDYVELTISWVRDTQVSVTSEIEWDVPRLSADIMSGTVHLAGEEFDVAPANETDLAELARTKQR